MLEITSSVLRAAPIRGLLADQTGQNYDTLIFGDVVSPFAERLEDPSQTAASDVMSASEVPATVATVSLPNVAVDRI